MVTPDPHPLLVEIGDVRGHRVFWRVERSNGAYDYEDDLVLASQDVEWGLGH